MATSVDKLYQQYYNQGLDELNKQKNTLRNTAESDKNIINTNADASVQNITDSYNTQINDTEDSYEDAFRSNEIQVKLNERYLERKAAEMGLTDSGMNRTQMTANQLSYANQKGELTTQRQKAVDTLAAAMKAKISEVDIDRNSRIAQVESTLNNNLAQMDTDYAAAVRQQAVDTYNTQIKAEQEAATARYKASLEATTAANKLAAENSTKALEAADDIIDKIDSFSYSKKALNGFIDNYIAQYGGGAGLRNIYNRMNKTSEDAWKDVVSAFVNNNNTDSYKKWRYITYVQTFSYPSKVAMESVSNIPGCGSYSYKYLKELAEEYI